MRFISLFSFTIVFTVNFAASAPDLNSFNSSQIPSKKSLGVDVNKPIQKAHIDYKSRVIKEKDGSLDIGKNSELIEPAIESNKIVHVDLEFRIKYQRYFGIIQLGFPSRHFRFSLETRFPSFWVSSQTCEGCLSRMRFDSLTDRLENYSPGEKRERFVMKYEGCLIEGGVYNDTLKIGNLVVKNYKFGVVNFLEGYGDTGWDGMLGLSITGRADWGPGLLFGLYDKGFIKYVMFGLSLSRGGGSGLTLGGYDTTKVRWKELSWNEINEPPNWVIPLEAVLVNGRNVRVRSMRAEIDTSARYIYAPYADYEKFHIAFLHKEYPYDYKTYHNSFHYQQALYDCHRPPQVSFIFNQVEYQVADVRRPGSLEVKGGYCYGVVVHHGHPPGTWRLGTPFLENVYAVFDVVNTRIGFYSIFTRKA